MAKSGQRQCTRLNFNLTISVMACCALIATGLFELSHDLSPIPQDPFTLISAEAPNAYMSQIQLHHCVGRPDQHFMFGGSGMAFAARAIQACTGELPRWLSLQYISPTPLGAWLELSVERLIGDRVAQLALTGHADGNPVLLGMAATGSRAGTPSIQAAAIPIVPPPHACALVRAHDRAEHDVHQNLEIRLARGRFGIFSKAPVSSDGHVHVWFRPRYGEVDAAALALVADFVPSTASNALGTRAGGSSLDNTIRIIRIVPTRWILCDISIAAINDGIGHGAVDLFAEDGTLMATASQSFIPRLLPARASSSA